MRRQSKRGLRASKYGCSVITSQQQTVNCNWCRSLVGEAGNSIIEKLPQSADWTEVKKELCSVLGEGDPKKRAFEVLSCYKPKSKGLGEMATDIMAKASLATNDADLQEQLGLKAFLQAVPRNFGHELRRQHFVSVKEALDEARFLQSVEEEVNRGSGKIFTVEAESEPSVEKPQMDIQQIVEACMKQVQAQQSKQTLLTYSLLLILRTILTLSPLLWDPLTIELFQLLHLLLHHLLSLLLSAIYGTLRTPGVLI